MGATASLPLEYDTTKGSFVVTLVLPAQQCNAHCSWCFIKNRQEANQEQAVLTSDEYLQFLEVFGDSAKTFNQAIDFVCLQGYEPLLDESLSYTLAIGHYCQEKKLPFGLVTNGYHLSSSIEDLKTVKPSHLAVSLDSSDALEHNRIRGDQFFQRAVEGLERVQTEIDLNLAVQSVLQPGKEHLLYGMPQLLSELDIKRWYVTPLINVGKRCGQPMISDRFSFAIRKLLVESERFGIECIIDDELHEFEGYSHIDMRRFNNVNRLIRVSPHGNLMQGKAINQKLKSNQPSIKNLTDSTLKEVLEQLILGAVL